MKTGDIVLIDEGFMTEQFVKILELRTIYSTVICVEKGKGDWIERGNKWDTMTGRLAKFKDERH